jgi:integrase
VIAANSGLTEGDICTLKWSEIDFAGRMIRRTRRKTGAEIILPLIPELAAYLSTLPRTSEYVLPEHAERYLKRRTSVPGKVKRFLESLGIKTTVSRDGIRNVSVKDLHSLRHIFCYRAKKAGVPEDLIAKMVGHKIVEMTRHYADHDTENDLRAQIRKLPALFVGERGDNQGEVERERLMELIPQLPIEVVRRWLGELSQGLPGTP